MGILEIISMVLMLVRYLPQIIALIHAIIALIHGLKGVPGFEGRVAIKELSEAVRYAKRHRDTSKLEALHKKLALALCPDAPPDVQPDPSVTAERVADELKALGREFGERAASAGPGESKL